MLRLIRDKLLQIVEDIDAGNSKLAEEETIILAKTLQALTDKTIKLSKYQACQMLNMSRATFDNNIREGKLPRGKKVAGFKELQWEKRDLEKYIRKSREKNKERKSKNNDIEI